MRKPKSLNPALKRDGAVRAVQQETREKDLPMNLRVLICATISSTLSGCMIVDRAEYTTYEVLANSAPWSYYEYIRKENETLLFYEKGIRVNISRGNIYIPGSPPPPLFPFYVCTVVDPGSKFGGAEIDPAKVTLELEGETRQAYLERRLPDRDGPEIYDEIGPFGKKVPTSRKLLESCWNLGFAIAAKDPRSPYTVTVGGLSAKGTAYPLPPVRFQYTPPGLRICTLPGCFASH